MSREKIEQEKKIHEYGFVRLVDYMGDDERVVQAARVSYASGTKSFREDRGLIRYLLKHAHTSPFEQVVFTFHVKMPIFVARQWIRHRTARLNEVSARYSVMEDEFYEPADADINLQSTDNKQGRGDEIQDKQLLAEVKEKIHLIHDETYKTYSDLIEKGVAREIARITLPTSLYTQMYWQMDLHNLFHFLWLRMDSHAQKEIRIYADVMYEMIKEICPLSCEAFEDFQLNKISIYGSEHIILQELLKNTSESQVHEIIASKELQISKRETNEFLQKLNLKRI